jgi:hypothetical protein
MMRFVVENGGNTNARGAPHAGLKIACSTARIETGLMLARK